MQRDATRWIAMASHGIAWHRMASHGIAWHGIYLGLYHLLRRSSSNVPEDFVDRDESRWQLAIKNLVRPIEAAAVALGDRVGSSSFTVDEQVDIGNVWTAAGRRQHRRSSASSGDGRQPDQRHITRLAAILFALPMSLRPRIGSGVSAPAIHGCRIMSGMTS